MSADDLELMKLIDQQYTKTPFYGTRKMMKWLRSIGHRINRKHVQRLMRLMGLEGLAPKPNTSKPRKAHKKYPYLLKGLKLDRPNQVWATDLTYIPMNRGFVYLVAIIDWYSRYVLSWRISNTMDTDFCVDALNDALSRHGKPEIFNSDQGSQFTSEDFTGLLETHGIRISMDGKGRWVDNVFVERLWRSLKWEEVYPKCYDTVFEAKAGIAHWMEFYNNERFHQALDYKTPRGVYSAAELIPSTAAGAMSLSTVINLIPEQHQVMIG